MSKNPSQQPFNKNAVQNGNPRQKNLDRRIKDYDMLKNKTGFHKPGSYK